MRKRSKIKKGLKIIDDPELVKICLQFDRAVYLREARKGIPPSQAKQKWRRLTPEQRKHISEQRRLARMVQWEGHEKKRKRRLSRKQRGAIIREVHRRLRENREVSKAASDLVDSVIDDILNSNLNT